MSCPTVTALVTSGICAKCDCHGMCKIEALVIDQIKNGMKLVTVRDALNTYIAKSSACERRKNTFKQIIEHSLELIGLPDTTLLHEMTEDKFDMLVEAMRKNGASARGTPYRDDTILQYIDSWKILDSDKSRSMYRKAGYDIMGKIDVDSSKYGLKHNEVQHVGIMQINRLHDEMIILKRGNKNERNVFLYLFLAIYFGLSKIDIINAKWENFQNTVSGKFFIQRRHKTDKEISEKVLPNVWAMIADFAKPSGYIIEFDTRGRKGPRTGNSLSRRASAVCKKIGIGGEYAGQKTGHACRKFKAQLTRSIFGVEAAARALGHTVAVDNRNYSSESSNFRLVSGF